MTPPRVRRLVAILAVTTVSVVSAVEAASAEQLSSFGGPAMGTTYRVALVALPGGMTTGEVHREVEAVLAHIDRAASTWRDDSDASRFNRAAVGAWLEVADDLVAILEIARDVHRESEGAFDVTATARAGRVAPEGAARVDRPAAVLPPAGMECIETRAAERDRPAAVRKTRGDVAIDLGGIGPGYAVDAIGCRLVALGSRAHLVELGGEVRGWGRPSDGRPWRVLVREGGQDAESARVIELDDGQAVAASTLRPGSSPIDPRTGHPVAGTGRTVVVRAGSCARADAWAVAAVVLGLAADAEGLVIAPPAPSTPAARPAATRAPP